MSLVDIVFFVGCVLLLLFLLSVVDFRIRRSVLVFVYFELETFVEVGGGNSTQALFH